MVACLSASAFSGGSDGGGQLTLPGKAATFFYWAWEAEPYLSAIWIRWRRPEHFASAAGRLAATFDFTFGLLGGPDGAAVVGFGERAHGPRRAQSDV